MKHSNYQGGGFRSWLVDLPDLSADVREETAAAIDLSRATPEDAIGSTLPRDLIDSNEAFLKIIGQAMGWSFDDLSGGA